MQTSQFLQISHNQKSQLISKQSNLKNPIDMKILFVNPSIINPLIEILHSSVCQHLSSPKPLFQTLPNHPQRAHKWKYKHKRPGESIPIRSPVVTVLHFACLPASQRFTILIAVRGARTQPKQCDQDSITIPRFISHCRLQGSRIGQSEPGPKLPAAPPWIYKGDRDPISRSSLSSLLSLSLSLEAGARVCVNRVAARLARERAQACFPWSHCRRPAKEAASLIGIPTRSLLLSPLCVSWVA